MTVCFIPSALASFEAAIDYYVSVNPFAAEHFRDRVLRTLGRLVRFPQIGHYIPEFPDEPFREVIVEPYRFFYLVEGETIWIIGVWHGAQLPALPSHL